MAEQEKTCTWKLQGDVVDTIYWETECGLAWCLSKDGTPGTPGKNGIRYCRYCGGRALPVMPTPAENDEAED